MDDRNDFAVVDLPRGIHAEVEDSFHELLLNRGFEVRSQVASSSVAATTITAAADPKLHDCSFRVDGCPFHALPPDVTLRSCKSKFRRHWVSQQVQVRRCRMRHNTVNYRHFIREHLHKKRLLQKDLACRVDRSPAWVSQMLAGKRPLQLSVAKRVGEVLDMSANDQLRLQALVQSEGNRCLSDEWEVAEHFTRAEPGLVTDVLLEPPFESWQLHAVFQLAQCEEFRRDPGWIAATIRPRMSEGEARVALEQLQARGLFDEPRAEPTAPPVEQRAPQPTAAYHLDTLELAKGALKTVPENDRTFLAGCVALSEVDYLRFRQHLQALVLHTVRTAAKATPNRVYHINLATFPVSLYSDSTADPRSFAE